MIEIEFAPILALGWLFIGFFLLLHDWYYHRTHRGKKYKIWKIHHGYIGFLLIVLGGILLYLYLTLPSK